MSKGLLQAEIDSRMQDVLLYEGVYGYSEGKEIEKVDEMLETLCEKVHLLI